MIASRLRHRRAEDDARHARRNRRLVTAVALFLAGDALFTNRRTSTRGSAPSEEQTDRLISDFRGTLLTGTKGTPEIRTLEDYRGHVVLLEYWATWCVPCGIGLRDLSSVSAAYAATDLRVVAVSIDPSIRVVDVQQEIARRDLTFDVLHDIGRHSQDAFGVWGVPMSFLIDRSGRVRRRVYGLRGDGASSHWAWPEARAQIDSLLREPNRSGARTS